jgi:hypothetical protein
MAYVPQFIPTNTQVLQGTLDQYQKGYDVETSRLNQVNDLYSAIPTTNPYDTVKKNEILGNFQKTVIDGLDKKYNYDRSNAQYSKELASEISKLRGNPLWTLVGQRAKIDELRQNLMATKGADYYENINPDTITDVNQLKNWQASDLKDVKQASALWGKERATSIKRQEKSYPSQGIVQFNNYLGYKDTEEADKYLSSKPGIDELNRTIVSAGFNPKDPRVFNAARDAALSNLVGTVSIDRVNDPEYAYRAAMAKSGKTTEGGGESVLLKTSTSTPIVKPYKTTNEAGAYALRSDLESVNENLKTEKDPVKISQLQDKKDQLELDLDKVDSVVNKYKNTDIGKSILKAGETLIKTYFPELKNSEASAIRDRIIKSKIGVGIPAEERLGLKGLITSASELPSTTEFLQNTDPVEFAKRLEDYNKNKKYNSNKDDIIYDLAAGVYKKELEASTTQYQSSGNKVQAGKKALQFISDIDSYYSGTKSYNGMGYKDISKDINKELETGERPVTSTYVLPSTMKSAEKTEIKDLIVTSLDSFSHINTSQGKENGAWTLDESNKLKTAFNDPNAEIKFLFDNEGVVFLQLNDPKTNTIETLRIDPAISSSDVLEELAVRTKDDRFLSQVYSGFDIASNKEYSLGDTSNYATRQLGNLFSGPDNKPDVSMFKDFRIKKIKDDSGRLEYQVFIGKDDKEPTKFPNKIAMVQKLAEFKMAQKENIKNVSRGFGARASQEKIDFSNIRSFDVYKDLIGKQESGNDYAITNRTSGALGKYQFMPTTLRSLGYNVSNEDFLNNPDLQEEAMNKLLSSNIDTLANYGYKIDPNNLTPEGIALLTVAHYGGFGAAKALINKSPWLKEKQTDNLWNTEAGINEEVVYPSVLEYLEQSMGIDSTKLNFGLLKK